MSVSFNILRSYYAIIVWFSGEWTTALSRKEKLKLRNKKEEAKKEDVATEDHREEAKKDDAATWEHKEEAKKEDVATEEHMEEAVAAAPVQEAKAAPAPASEPPMEQRNKKERKKKVIHLYSMPLSTISNVRSSSII